MQNKNYNSNMIWQKVRKIAIIIGFVTTIYCLIRGVPNFPELWFYWLIPLSYGLYHACAKRIFRYEHGLALGIVEITMFIRYIVTPIITCSFEDQSRLFIYNDSRKNLGLAVFLMIYEIWAVFFALHFVLPRIMKVQIGFINRKGISVGDFRKNRINILQLGIILFWIYILMVSPECRSYLFRFTNIRVQTISQQEFQSGIPGVYLVFYFVGAVTIYATLINIIQKQRFIFKWKAVRLFTILASSVFFVSSTWSNGESVSRWALMIGSIVMIYILVQNFPESTKYIYLYGAIVMVVMLLFGSFAKSFVLNKGFTFTESIDNYISMRYINEYFAGVFPVANGITVAQRIEDNFFFVFLYDVFANVPYFLSKLNLGSSSSLIWFRTLTGRPDLIMPTIASGYAVFTVVFAPLYSMILCILAFWAEKKLRSSYNALVQVFWLYIVYWCSLFMAVNINIVQSACWQYVIGLALITIGNKLLIKQHR